MIHALTEGDMQPPLNLHLDRENLIMRNALNNSLCLQR